MNMIFLTLSRMTDIRERGIYTDLMRKFWEEGHRVYIVFPEERRFHQSTSFVEQEGIHLLGVRTLNIQKTHIVEKGIGTILLESQFKRAIRKYLADVRFDLILYSTPPITFTNVVRFLKKRNHGAISYLLLKDIFPQNAVDLRMFSKRGLFYAYFRRKEIGLYKSSDYIGCMSPANVDFVLRNNPFIAADRVEVAPNSIEISSRKPVDRESVRRMFHLPLGKPIFIYGGNLGKPQGIDFLIQCMDRNREREDCCFLIVGNGTEYGKLRDWYDRVHPKSVFLFERLPKEDYDRLVQSCDVGLIFLDHRFTIPNYPSRLLSYLEYKMPIIAATDKHTDIGRIAEANGYGYGCESVHPEDFSSLVNRMIAQKDRIREMGEKGYRYLLDHYLVEHTYRKIIGRI